MTGLSWFPWGDFPARTLTDMTTYAARHVALEGDDSEPEGLASSWGDGPAPRRAMMPEAAAGFGAYESEPDLVPFTAVAQQDLQFRRPAPSEFGEPVVALAPSQTMQWHLAAESHAPLDPGPLDATAPISDAAVDPASVPTPVSAFGAFAYQSMPSPSPYTSVLSPAPYSSAPQQPTYAPAPPQATYASVPAQGGLAAPMASPDANPAAYGPPGTDGSWVHRPQTVEQALDLVLPPEAGKALKTVVTVQRIFSLAIVLVVVGTFTVAGFSMGGSNAWFIVGFAWLVGILITVGTFMPGRVRMGWRA